MSSGTNGDFLVIGPGPVVNGFYWLAGQGGYGIQTAHSAARAIAGLVVEGELPADLLGVGLRSEHLSPARPR